MKYTFRSRSYTINPDQVSYKAKEKETKLVAAPEKPLKQLEDCCHRMVPPPLGRCRPRAKFRRGPPRSPARGTSPGNGPRQLGTHTYKILSPSSVGQVGSWVSPCTGRSSLGPSRGRHAAPRPAYSWPSPATLEQSPESSRSPETWFRWPLDPLSSLGVGPQGVCSAPGSPSVGVGPP